MLNCYETQHDEKTYKGHRVAAKKVVSFVLERFWLTHFVLYLWLF